MIPKTTPAVIVKTLERFDLELRDTAEWAGWEQKENNKYAIQHQGRLYPVKRIISLATNAPINSFSGGAEANNYIAGLGFSVVQLREDGADGEQRMRGLQNGFNFILAEYLKARAGGRFGKEHPLWSAFGDLQKMFEASDYIKKTSDLKVSWSVGKGNWARIPWIAFLDSRETSTTQRGVYGVYLFRQDMSGVYLCLAQGVKELKDQLGTTEARNLLSAQAKIIRSHCRELGDYGFRLDSKIDLHADAGLGVDYEYSTAAYKFYDAQAIPSDAEITKDLHMLLKTYDHYIGAKNNKQPVDELENNKQQNNEQSDPDPQPMHLEQAVSDVVSAIAAAGFYFEPWQIAAYITALRTKPFVILAGVSGTGKSKLPVLVAENTGGQHRLLPVRPDWTDSSDVLGYCDLRGNFRPGPLLEYARLASSQRDKHFVCILDEMNLARVEQYFAEVLSRIEDRRLMAEGGYASGPLVSIALQEGDAAWAQLGLPPNLAIVGTVNMDESTYGFSRKVLDRAFTIELSDIDLTVWERVVTAPVKTIIPWPVTAWFPRGARLGDLANCDRETKQMVEDVIRSLTAINSFLTRAQLQVGYRVRDEIVLFVLHAREIPAAFVTSDDDPVDPLDLALQMKVLPRIAGGSNAIRQVVLQLLGWTYRGSGFRTEEEATTVTELWESEGRQGSLSGARFPRTAARLCLMWERLQGEGFTSFWL